MNRNFLVTGGAQGIGHEMCRQILSKGGRVFLTDINTDLGKKTREELGKEFGQKSVGFGEHDVTKEDDWKRVWDEAEKFFEGRVEALCNNAGIFHKTEWKKMLDINLMGAAYGTMLAMEKMGATHGGPGGLIVQTASAASFLAGFPTVEQSAYTASKHALLGYVRGLAKEEVYKREKVRMVGLCPTFVNTELVKSQISSPQEIKDKYNLRVLETSEVGVAFDRLVVNGLSGQMLVVMPGFNFFWPDCNPYLLKIFSLGCLFYIKVMGHKSSEPVTPDMFVKAFFIAFFILAYIFHILLSWIGY